MKCEKCGGNLTLEDVVCPHCEALNEHAVEHIREMNRYKQEFEDTREEVYSVTKSYAGITTRIAVIAVLVILTIVCGFIRGGGLLYQVAGNEEMVAFFEKKMEQTEKEMGSWSITKEPILKYLGIEKE